MAGDREAVGFVAYMLDQMQCRRAGIEIQRAVHGFDEQRLQAGLSCRALGDADQRHADDFQLDQNLPGHVQLALAAIDDQDVGQFAFAFLQPFETAGQRLSHGRVIVTGGHALDIEAPIVGLGRAVLVEHDAGSHCCFAMAVADIETLQPRGRRRHVQGCSQRFEALAQLTAVGELGGQMLLGVGDRQSTPLGTMAADLRRHPDPAAGVLAQCRLEEFAVRHRMRSDDLERDLLGLAEIELADELAQQFAGAKIQTVIGLMVPRAQHAPLTNGQYADAQPARLLRQRKDIGVAIGVVDVLLLLQSPQLLNLIPQPGGFLEIEGIARALHAGSQLLRDLLAAPLEAHHGVLYILAVVGFADVVDAGRAAALDLVLQAGSLAMGEHAVFAVADAKDLLHQRKALAHRGGAGVGAQVTAVATLLPNTLELERGVRVPIGDEDIGVRFVVAKQDVVRGPQLLDQGLLEQQRFGFATGNRDLNVMNPGDQRLGLGVQCATEVAGQSWLESLGLADVEHVGLLVEHAVHARGLRDRLQEMLGVEARWGIDRGFTHPRSISKTRAGTARIEHFHRAHRVMAEVQVRGSRLPSKPCRRPR